MVEKKYDLRLQGLQGMKLVGKQPKEKDFSHISKKKTCFDLLRLSAAVMGIELAYSAETAFVSPVLLELGLEHDKMTLVWAISPFLGLFLGPLLGSVSDRCRSKLGRRRPLVLVLAVGLLAGLVMVPFGKDLGILLGDSPHVLADTLIGAGFTAMDLTVDTSVDSGNFSQLIAEDPGTVKEHQDTYLPMRAIIITILGTVLLDFNADVCQGPIRAYLVEVSITEDHAKGLSTFTVMAGVGGFVGYALGAVDWSAWRLGALLGGGVNTVFLMAAAVFVVCVIVTVTSFEEVPLAVMEDGWKNQDNKELVLPEDGHKLAIPKDEADAMEAAAAPEDEKMKNVTFLQHLKTVVLMPGCMKILCLTNLLNWMSHLSYTLYFTDFVGESVFGGNPKAPVGSESLEVYNEGVRFGCWGLAVYSFSCAVYSYVLGWLIKKFRAKTLLVCGFLMYAVGMVAMAWMRTPLAALVFSAPAGIAYSTLFTIPYIIVARYHTEGTFNKNPNDQVRGLGTDIAIVGSTVFVAQLFLSLGLSWLSHTTGSASSAMWLGAGVAAAAAISATQVSC